MSLNQNCKVSEILTLFTSSDSCDMKNYKIKKIHILMVIQARNSLLRDCVKTIFLVPEFEISLKGCHSLFLPFVMWFGIQRWGSWILAHRSVKCSEKVQPYIPHLLVTKGKERYFFINNLSLLFFLCKHPVFCAIKDQWRYRLWLHKLFIFLDSCNKKSLIK